MQKMVAKVGKPFCAILGWPVSGDVLNNTSDIFSVRWSSIVSRRRIAQKMVAKVGEVVLRNSWMAVFGGCFEFVRRTSEKTIIQYSTIEFKVIGIVYIVGYSIVGYSIVGIVHDEPRCKRPYSGT